MTSKIDCKMCKNVYTLRDFMKNFTRISCDCIPPWPIGKEGSQDEAVRRMMAIDNAQLSLAEERLIVKRREVYKPDIWRAKIDMLEKKLKVYETLTIWKGLKDRQSADVMEYVDVSDGEL